MNYWWVNQKQTHRHEVGGGYMWSPKFNKNGRSNVCYENMTKVEPGDVLFSFFNSAVSAMGVITSRAYSQDKPNFGASGDAWDTDGWMVNVDYTRLKTVLPPRDHMDLLGPLLPKKYSPIRPNGLGNQVYLRGIPDQMGRTLIDLIGGQADPVLAGSVAERDAIQTDDEAAEQFYRKLIEKRTDIDATTKQALVESRKGQGRFRKDVLELHKCCPVSGVTDEGFLKAGHIKRWSKSGDDERLDPLNGLPFSPNIDLLFEKGYISFDDAGEMIVSDHLNHELSTKLGFDRAQQVNLTIHDPRQVEYFRYHREHSFKG